MVPVHGNFIMEKVCNIEDSGFYSVQYISFLVSHLNLLL